MTTSQNYSPLRYPRSVRHDIRGVDYHVLEWGDPSGSLLVLLHGWADCAASFQFLVDELASPYFVVAPDWRGFGRTSTEARCYWFPDYLADLDELLAIYAPDHPADLLGHSMGANAAALYAGCFPERVGRLVNVEGFGLPDSDPSGAPANYRRWIERMRDTPAYATYADFDELAARIRKRSPSMPIERARFIAEQWAVRAPGGRVVLRADPAHRLPNAILHRRAEAEACWRSIRAQVLLVMGENSPFAEALADWRVPEASKRPIPGAETVVVKGAGHMVHFERPAELAAAAAAFFGPA